MATRFINQGVEVPDGIGHVAGFAVGVDGVLKINRGPEFKGSLSADPGAEPVAVNRVVAIAATATTHTAVAADAGALFAFSSTTTQTLVLPKVSTAGKGFEVSAVVGALTSAGGHTVRPNAADTILFTGAGASSALQCSAATDVLGDTVTLRADGTTTWYIVSKVGTWAAIA
jgi:hypothetical protein